MLSGAPVALDLWAGRCGVLQHGRHQDDEERGEHWVCAVLSGLGWGAALTRDGLERTDILAVWTGEPRALIEVQVKSASHGSQNWRVGTKAQQRALSDREWFVMVALAAKPWLSPRS